MFHRDIKLENILVETGTSAPNIWIIDFGCATLVSDCSNTIQGKASRNRPVHLATFHLYLRLTDKHCVCVTVFVFPGTAGYTPPEWFLHSIYDPEPTTVWQVGIVMYAMLHSYFPFGSTHAVVHEEPEVKKTLSLGE